LKPSIFVGGFSFHERENKRARIKEALFEGLVFKNDAFDRRIH